MRMSEKQQPGLHLRSSDQPASTRGRGSRRSFTTASGAGAARVPSVTCPVHHLQSDLLGPHWKGRCDITENIGGLSGKCQAMELFLFLLTTAGSVSGQPSCMLVSARSPWLRTPKTPLIPKVIGPQGASFALTTGLWVGSRACHLKAKS